MISAGKIKWIDYYPLLLLLVNLVTKSWFLTDQDISLDEPFSVYHAQFNFAEIISQLKNYNNPPLFELILHGWIKCFGISPLSVRIPALLFASAAPPALFLFCMRNFNTPVAITSSLLLSASSLVVYYAHDCRVYSLFLLLCIGSMFFFMELLRQPTRTRHAILFILLNALLLYAHYFGIFILLIQTLFLLVFYRNQLLKLFVCYLAIALLYLPHVYQLITRLTNSVASGTWLLPPEGIASLYNMLWSFSNEPVVTVLSLIMLVAGCFYYVVNKNKFPISPNLVLVSGWFVIPYFGLFLISYQVPVYISRYLIFILPAYYILISGCIDSLFKTRLARTVVFSLFALLYIGSTDLRPDKKRQIQPAIQLIQSIKDSTTLVIVTSTDFLPTFSYHYNRDFFSSIKSGKEYVDTEALLQADRVIFVNKHADLKTVRFIQYKKIICLVIGRKPEHNFILRELEDRGSRVYYQTFNDSYSLHVFKNELQ